MRRPRAARSSEGGRPPSGRAWRAHQKAKQKAPSGDGVTDVTDVFFVINFLFAGGPLPV
jgi:hypothetical protein